MSGTAAALGGIRVLDLSTGAAYGNRPPPNPLAHLTAREHTPPTSRGSR